MSLEKAVVITGASTGIGRASVASAVKGGATVFAAVREDSDAASLQTEFGSSVIPLIFDVRDGAAIDKAAEQVAGALGGGTLFGLVNNAGIALPAPAILQPFEEVREQIETNLLGQIAVTQAFAPLLGADKARQGAPGRIVVMSSIAGEVAQPYMSIYAATKHALEGFSDSLRRELQIFDIKVVIVGPGLIATPIWAKARPFIGRYAGTPFAETFDKAVQKITETGEEHGLSAQKVGDLVWEALTAKNPKIRYAPAAHPLIEQVLPRATPRRWLDAAVRIFPGLRRP